MNRDSAIRSARFENLWNEAPMIEGGLTAIQQEDLRGRGFERRTIIGDRHDHPVSFKSDLPGGVVIKYGTVPDGTVAWENDDLGISILERCGNP